MIIKVTSTPQDSGYSIRLKSGLLSKAGQIIKKTASGRIVVLTNKTVYRLWYKELHKSFKKAGLKESTIIIPDGEDVKTEEGYEERIYIYNSNDKPAYILYNDEELIIPPTLPLYMSVS